MKIRVVAVITLAALLCSCGKRKSEVSILHAGSPIVGAKVILQISRFNGESGKSTFASTTNPNGVAQFDGAPDGDSLYHLMLIDADGHEIVIASGGRGEFGRVGDWREDGYSVSLRKR